MVEARGIEVVSIPFAAGIALACCPLFPKGDIATLITLSLACLVLTGIVTIHRRDEAIPTIAMLFLVLGAFCRMNEAALHLEDGFVLAGTPMRSRDALESLIGSVGFGQKCTALLTALLAGDRGGIDPDTATAFRNSGASHILALSGLHMGVIYLLLGRALSPLGKSRQISILRSMILIMATGYYTLLTGAGPSIMRAWLFILINEFLKHNPARRRNPMDVLSTALMLQLAIHPSYITSVGFQLSYLAIAGIMFIHPAMKQWNKTIGLSGRIWNSISMSLSCQITTAPLVWIRFHTFPKYFLLTNLLSLPLAEMLIITALISMFLSLMGICPAFMIQLTDYLAEALLTCLRIIASM